jgi:hypothetical protein
MKPPGNSVKRNVEVGPNAELIALFDSIAERGSRIPQKLRDEIWHDLEVQGFCAGSGPIPD